MATMIRMSRTSMLDVISQDYIRTAKAKGASMRRIISHHAMRNSLIPVVTQMGVSFAGTIGGAVVTENIFGIPGIGTMLLSAVKSPFIKARRVTGPSPDKDAFFLPCRFVFKRTKKAVTPIKIGRAHV